MAKVMLVEDDNNLRQIYEDRLAAEGYQIVSAKDGEEALALAVKERPDLIIADIMMPKVSGFDMLDILRSTPETKDTKIIMMTALSQAEDRQHAEKLGADRYLVKSQVTLEDVARVAGEMLEGHTDAASSAPAATSSSTPAASAPSDATPTPAPTTANIPVTTAPPADEPAASPVGTAPLTAAAASDEDDNKDEEEKAPEVSPAPAESQAAKELSVPAKEEKAEMNEQIDEFIASNPTLSDSAEVAEKKEEEKPEEVASTPEVKDKEGEPVSTPSASTSTPIKVEVTEAPAEPAEKPPEPTTAPALTEEQSDKVASAVDGLLKETEKTPEETKPEAPSAAYVSESGPSQNSSEGTMTHERKIEPLADTTTTAPDLNELLAKEAAHEPTPPAVSSVISPGGSTATPQATPDEAAPTQTIAPAPAASSEAAQNDHDTIAL